MGMEVVIVGGSTAGFICSLTARRFYKDAKITVVRREKKALVTCGIPYIFGTLFNIEKDLLPDKLLTDNDIELVIGEVKSIRRDEKAVILSSGQKINYDKLVLATGSVPAKPPIPGIDLENVFFAKKDPDYLQGAAREAGGGQGRRRNRRGLRGGGVRRAVQEEGAGRDDSRALAALPTTQPRTMSSASWLRRSFES
jgi:NADPH-dependent 2,4-dienoyl-CoA reductase/sulfur reductase-like enzyme